MADADVSSKFRCCMVVGELDARLVVLEHFDRTAHELSRNALYHLDDPQQQLRDVS